MKTLLKIRPFFFFLGFFGIFALSFYLLTLWSNLVNDDLKPYGFVIFLTFFLTYYYFWIYVIGYGFILIDKKYDIHLNGNKFLIVIILSIISYLTGYFLSMYFLLSNGTQVSLYLNTFIGIVALYCFFYIAINLTNNFKSYEKKGEPRIIDYIITMFLLCFVPFGLWIMHSHQRLILKDQELLD